MLVKIKNINLSSVVLFTSELCKNTAEFAGDALHLIVGQSDNSNVFWNVPKDLEHTVWEGNELTIGQICRGERGIYTQYNTTEENVAIILI